MTKKNPSTAKTKGKTAEKGADESGTAPEEKTANTSETSEPTKEEIKAAQKVLDDAPVPTEGRLDLNDYVPEGFRRFELSDVLLVLAEVRTDLAKISLMSGTKSTGHSISILELKSGLIEIPVKRAKEA